MFRLSALYRYPIKSSAAESLERVALDALGVVGDRRWMAVDTETGRFFTQRLLPQLGRIQARWAAPEVLRLNAPGMSELSLEVPAADANLRGVTVWRDTLQAPDAGDAAADWLTRFLGRPTRLVHIPEARARQVDTGYAEPGQKVHFADGFPLLLIGQASLDDLSQRVGRPLEMLRFRPNLVVEGSAAFAEDGWKRIRIGSVEFVVAKPCSRCILTTLDPATGERNEDREPLTTLKTYREKDGAVLFGQNLIALGQGSLEVGDAGGNPRLRNGRPPLRRAAIAGDQSLASTQPVLRHSALAFAEEVEALAGLLGGAVEIDEITVVLAFAAGRVALLDPGDLALLQQGFLAVVQVLAQGAELLVQLAVGLGKLAAAAIHAVEGVARRTAGVGGQGAVGEQQAGGGEQGGSEGLVHLEVLFKVLERPGRPGRVGGQKSSK
ncbi:molybdenum cofactor sulfurase [Pseudomonas aeruginosa]|nr:molybdenum cofactor sulfurase [Pseudomonas aeruginosa]